MVKVSGSRMVKDAVLLVKRRSVREQEARNGNSLAASIFPQSMVERRHKCRIHSVSYQARLRTSVSVMEKHRRARRVEEVFVRLVPCRRPQHTRARTRALLAFMDRVPHRRVPPLKEEFDNPYLAGVRGVPERRTRIAHPCWPA